ncbi:hypothetical protein Zm00014a_015548 [Zea mays]|jgi:hypothetical protein|uniref:Reverse transcriptase domain-containing protein n=1 Tax=Zea mays TaxID=4577 RepID=A0A3L6F0J7_MAIZE|nr:hypothetical protein Zm00014a_015548 [Zea mays]
MATFADFHSGELQLFNLNFGTIILLPKCKEAVKNQQFRPICLLNVSFKDFWKVLLNKLTSGVVVLHKTMHEMHRKKINGVFFKIDFKKAYDKVNWSFMR